MKFVRRVENFDPFLKTDFIWEYPTLMRTYTDKEGNLQDTSNFRAKDMLGLSETARRAHHITHEYDRETFKERRRAEQTPHKTKNRGQSRWGASEYQPNTL
ncbi:MAG: hypothetical protein ABJL99_09240 [Aliishimia sp.]